MRNGRPKQRIHTSSCERVGFYQKKEIGQNLFDSRAKFRSLKYLHRTGIKFYLENDNWLLLRFSGTEPILRMFAEADSPEKAHELLDYLKQFVMV